MWGWLHSPIFLKRMCRGYLTISADHAWHYHKSQELRRHSPVSRSEPPGSRNGHPVESRQKTTNGILHRRAHSVEHAHNDEQAMLARARILDSGEIPFQKQTA